MTHPHPDLRGQAEHGLMQGFPPPPDKRVTAENGLWGVPHNRWSYQNMRRLLPSAPIVGLPAAASMPRRPVAGIDDVVVRREDGSPADIATFLAETFTDSMVVVRGDEIVWERHLNGMTAATPHQMMSCTKSFIGMFALVAANDGVLAEDDLVIAMLPELAGSAFATASLGQVLDMTNSVHFNEDYDDPAAHIHEYAGLIGLGPGHSDAADDIPAHDDPSHFLPGGFAAIALAESLRGLKVQAIFASAGTAAGRATRAGFPPVFTTRGAGAAGDSGEARTRWMLLRGT